MLLFEWTSRIETVGRKLPGERVCGKSGIRKNCGNLWKNQNALRNGHL